MRELPLPISSDRICTFVGDIAYEEQEHEDLMQFTPKNSSPKDLTWDGIIYYDVIDDDQYQQVMEDIK